jgi:hypothetical protein
MPTRFPLAALLLAASPLFAADWPQFRGPGGLGVTAEKAPTTWSGTDNLAWKAALPGPGTSSPVVVGSRIFLTCYTGYNVPGQPRGEQDQLKLHVLCYNRDDGTPAWTKDVAPKLPEQEKIRDDHGYASGTPAVDSERVYVFFGKSGVIAFTHAGEQLWRADVGSNLNGWGSATSPVLFGDLVIVNASVESDSLVALNKKTGEEVWRTKGIRESWSTPILHEVGGKTELVVAIFGKLLGLDPATGKQLWACDTGISWYMVPGLVAHDGVVYCIGGRSGGALAVRGGGSGDVTATHRVWTGKKGANVSSPVHHDGHLYWMNEAQERAYCADAKTGAVVYEQAVNRAGQVYASPVVAGGKVYYLSRNGKAFVVAAKPTFELLATNDFGDRSTFNASPAVAGGKLFVRSDKFLYCVGK